MRISGSTVTAPIVALWLCGACGGGGDASEPVDLEPDLEEMETTYAELTDQMCDCYTNDTYGGDRAACEQSYQDRDPTTECFLAAYEQDPAEASEYIQCQIEAMEELRICVSGCPAAGSLELGKCAGMSGAREHACKEAAPVDFVSEWEACMPE